MTELEDIPKWLRTFLRFSILSLMLFLPQIGQAQIFLNFGPDPSIRPFIFAFTQDEYIPESKIRESVPGSSQKPFLAIQHEDVGVNLAILEFKERNSKLIYRKDTELASLLSDSDLDITKADLPAKLYQQSSTLNLGIPLGEDILAINLNDTISTDKKEVDLEDRNTLVAVNYVSDPKAQMSWRFGFFQRSLLGQFGPVYPMTEIAFNESDSEIGIGAIHLSENPTGGVAPFFRYRQKTQTEVEVNILLPYRFKAYTKFFDSLSLELSVERLLDYYRLTKEAPWNRSVLSTDKIRSTFEVGYHFLGVFLLQAGVGNVASRKFTFFEEDLDRIVDFSIEQQSLANHFIALAFNVNLDVN